MTGTGLGEAFTREHHEIDAGIQAYLDGLDSGGSVAPLQTAMHALRRHIYLEERFMFPPLREAGLMMPILVMLKEHGELWRRMDEIDVALADRGDPAELRQRCQEMLDLLEAHNSKEEPIVYPKADSDLSEHQQEQSGPVPRGWDLPRRVGLREGLRRVGRKPWKPCGSRWPVPRGSSGARSWPVRGQQVTRSSS